MSIPRLEAARNRAESGIRRLVQERVPGAKVFSLGAIDIDPGLLAIWVATPTDAQRDELKSDEGLLSCFREILIAADYPESAVPNVGFGFESEETVNRDWAGKWHNAVR